MAPISDERRAHSRHLVLLKVAIKDETALRNLHATNLSKGGMFVATRKPLPMGRSVKVRLVHPVSEATLEVSAEVVNCRKGKDGEVSGCGLKFEAFDDDARQALAHFVDGVVEPRTAETPAAVAEASADEGAPASGGENEDKLRAHALMLRGMSLAHSGNLVGAAHLLARAVSLDPEEEELWQALRKLEGRLESAASERASASADPSAPDGEPAQVEASVKRSEPAVLDSPERRKAKLFFEIAKKSYVSADFDGAVAWLEKAVDLDPEHAPALYALAGLITERGEEIPRALELCRRATTLDPDNEDYQNALESLESLTSG